MNARHARDREVTARAGMRKRSGFVGEQEATKAARRLPARKAVSGRSEIVAAGPAYLLTSGKPVGNIVFFASMSSINPAGTGRLK